MQFESNTPIELERPLKRRVRRYNHNWDFILELPVMVLACLPRVTDAAKAEARRISITRQTLEIPQLTAPFDGLTVAFLTDLHCSPTTPPAFLQQVVDATNRLHPDLILLGGDYIGKVDRYVDAVGAVLAHLRAPLGVYGVLGNHDYYGDPECVREMLAGAGVVDLTNTGRWLHRNGSRLRIAGIGDLWGEVQDLPSALAGAQKTDAVILISHNPDYVMRLHDPRVKLVLSGHTHGGQIRLPGIGALITNSRYGQRLVSGLIRFDTFQLYTSRGIGTVVVPLRWNCPPEIALFTLRPGAK